MGRLRGVASTTRLRCTRQRGDDLILEMNHCMSASNIDKLGNRHTARGRQRNAACIKNVLQNRGEIQNSFEGYFAPLRQSPLLDLRTGNPLQISWPNIQRNVQS